jgi:predicted nucleic acid-binding Zn ribbon protein
MRRDKDTYVLQCPDCGSHRFEIRDLARKNAVVQCARCDAKIARWDEFLASVDQERRKRRFH